MKQNFLLFILCILINLLIGNILLAIMATGLSLIYHIIISITIFLIYGIVFYTLNLHHQKIGKWQLSGIAIGLSLLALLTACIFTSISSRLPMDGIIIAGLKGIIPLFIFAIVFASPIWLPLALFNFVCLNFIKPKI